MTLLVKEFINLKKQNMDNFLTRLFYITFCLCTACVGMEIHHNRFYAVVNFLLAPFSWLYWWLTDNVHMIDIHNAFSFLH